jgi:hypothetical protein
MNVSLAGSERVRCRNSKCRSKLSTPTSNDHKAFCTPYCFNRFYKRKCLVCEKPLPEGHRRQLCSARQCRLDYRNFRPAYVRSRHPQPTEPKCKTDARSAHFTGAKSAINSDRATYRGGIVGPRYVIQAAVTDSRKWTEVISSDGVTSYVSQIGKRALVEGAAP